MKKYIFTCLLTFILLHSCQTEHKYFNIETYENTSRKYYVFKDNSEFSFNNIPYGSDQNFLIHHLGKPLSIDSTEIGGHVILIYNYDGFYAELTNDHIYLMKSNSPKFSTPNGISPGLNKQRIAEIYDINKEIIDFEKNEWQISNIEMITAVYIFNDQGILTELEFGIDLP